MPRLPIGRGSFFGGNVGRAPAAQPFNPFLNKPPMTKTPARYNARPVPLGRALPVRMEQREERASAYDSLERALVRDRIGREPPIGLRLGTTGPERFRAPRLREIIERRRGLSPLPAAPYAGETRLRVFGGRGAVRPMPVREVQVEGGWTVETSDPRISDDPPPVFVSPHDPYDFAPSPAGQATVGGEGGGQTSTERLVFLGAAVLTILALLRKG